MKSLEKFIKESLPARARRAIVANVTKLGAGDLPREARGWLEALADKDRAQAARCLGECLAAVRKKDRRALFWAGCLALAKVSNLARARKRTLCLLEGAGAGRRLLKKLSGSLEKPLYRRETLAILQTVPEGKNYSRVISQFFRMSVAYFPCKSLSLDKGPAAEALAR